MQWIESAFLWLGNFLQSTLPAGNLSDLLVNGVLAGLGGTVIFIPQIALLFTCISILEDTGYLSRVSFLLDKSMRRFGLSGKSVIPLLSGTACAVPAIMSARSIDNRKERLITIFITPLMSCSARIPVYTLLIALLIPADQHLGIFNLQGILMMSLYLIGILAAIGSGAILNLLLKTKTPPPFVFEVPVYRSPRWKSVLSNVYGKVRSFVMEAGKIIVAISIVLWALSSFGPSSSSTNTPSEKSWSVQKTDQLEQSYAGKLGKKIEPFIRPLGFDWKIGISLITSFAAREVFVGTMATIYAVENPDNTMSIRDKMKNAEWPGDGGKIYNTATVCSLLIFYAFALQCMSTIAVVKKETKSWKWPLLQLVYLTSLAYISSFIVYRILI
jgi:ferrous iron transport protein B